MGVRRHDEEAGSNQIIQAVTVSYFMYHLYWKVRMLRQISLAQQDSIHAKIWHTSYLKC